MLWTVGILAFLGWLIGLMTVREQVGGGLHVLLALSLLAFGYAFVRRSRGRPGQATVKRTSHSPPEARSRA